MSSNDSSCDADSAYPSPCQLSQAAALAGRARALKAAYEAQKDREAKQAAEGASNAN